jgi:hypothetical protein
MMLLAHVAGWQYSEIMEMPIAELRFWATEALNLHNEMNRTPSP